MRSSLLEHFLDQLQNKDPLFFLHRITPVKLIIENIG